MGSLSWRHRGREHFCTSEECASHVCKWIGTFAVLLLLFSTLVCVDFVIKYRSGLIANACCLMVLFGAGTLAPPSALPQLQLSAGKSASHGNQTFNCSQMLKPVV